MGIGTIGSLSRKKETVKVWRDDSQNDVDAALYWPAYTALNAIVPERILRNPAGSRGDILFNAAAFENSRHGYEHRTSGNQELIFIP